MYAWLYKNRRYVLLKVAVACMLTASHYYPESKMGLLVNLLWLALF